MKIQVPRAEQGSALLITLMAGALIGFSLVAYLTLVENQNRSIARAQAWNSSMAVVEGGLEEALTHLQRNWGNLESDGWALTGGAYVKQASLGDGQFLTAISNVNPPVIYAQGFVHIPNSSSNLPPRTVRVTTAGSAMFGKGIVAKGAIDINGNNIRTDSFDSVDPAFSTNGRYDSSKAKDNGDIATNSTLTNSLNVGNAKIYGHASTGPGGNANLGANGAVGKKAWISSGNHGVQSGQFTDDMNVSFIDIQAPFSSATTPGGGAVSGTNYTFVLGAGNYMLSSLSLSGQNKMLISGKAVLYVTGNLSMSGSSYIYISPGASLSLYVGGASASLAGNGIANANANATNFAYYGLPSNTSLSLSGNASLTGTVYASNAAVSLGGGGNDDYDFVGAIVAGSVRLNGHYSFHYDENLARSGPSSGFVVTSWNEI